MLAMLRGLCLALAAALLASSALAQTPTSTLYVDSLQAGGLPYRIGDGFYTPAGCNYVVDYYSQCGGSGAGCNPASGVCADAQYPGACCPVGFLCQRANAQYWQCVADLPSYTMAPDGAYPLNAFDQCGGSPPENTSFTTNAVGQFVGVACPDGYSCTYQNAEYSLCSPNPLTDPQSMSQGPLLNIVNELSGLSHLGGSALAPGLEQYDFTVPGKVASPPKPVEVVLNVTAITDFFDKLLNVSSPPPPAAVSPPPPGAVAAPPPPPSVPAPAPSVNPAFNFTVPNINFAPPPPISISGTSIVNSSGDPIAFNGFNWFGFENGETMVDGLYTNYLNPRNFSQVGDFATIVYRQQALGFNAVRLPFRFADLNIAPPKDYTRACSADSLAEIIGNLTNPTVPYYQINYAAANFPAQVAPVQPPLDVATSGLCNAYLPQDTTLNRFLWVVQFFIGNGFYVAIDYHGGQGNIELDRQVVANQTLFAQNWLGLLSAFQSLPTWQNGTLPGRIIFDLLNEPDAWNFTWGQPNINSNGQFANSSTVPAWGDLYTNTANALLTQDPSLLLFVEGTGQRNQPGTAYGMGFGINPAIYTNVDGLFNALPGLQTLAGNALVKAHTIITPHIYGFQVTGWTIGNTNGAGLGLPYTYYNNFAYLSSAGVPTARGGPNATFPIVIGEFGNTFNSSYNSTFNDFSDPLSDLWIHDLAEFANNLDPVNATAYPHEALTSTFWWDWNANSLPPLGLVNADPGAVTTYTGPLQPGWLTIQWIKINNLTDVLTNNPFYSAPAADAAGGGFGLRPWYLPPYTH